MNFVLERGELRDIAEKVSGNIRLSEDDSLRLFATRDLPALGALADLANRRRNGLRASYILNRYINYSNYCILSCQFCAFSRKKRDADGFELNADQIVAKAREALALGITELHIVGGLHPSLPFSYYTGFLRALRALDPRLQLKCFTAIEVLHLAWLSKKPVPDTLAELRDAGLASLTGGGAEIFRKEVRARIAKGKESGAEYLDVHRQWHRLGGKSTCTMLFGHVETHADRADHLCQLRALQDETHGFTGFIPLPYQPENNRNAKANAEKAAGTAEDAVKAKQQFLSNMSHEIRTPMNAIIGFTKVVLKTELTAKQKEYLTAIKMSGDALIVLINDILDLAKVDAGKMAFEQTPFRLADSIAAMLHLFETKVQEKILGLFTKYDTSIPEVIMGDVVRLHQIILNLVSNAVKFTHKGNITVSANRVAEEEETITIKFAVADTGIGIPANKMDSVFENFQQASSSTSRIFGGTGLGLAIVKQLVEAQGGSVGVTSNVGEGSTFWFILNFQKTKEIAEREPAVVEVNAEIRNIKVLVVEDIALNQLLMKTLLDDFGFERDIAANGLIAIEKLKSKSYDIILMDLQMPEMNGFEATEYIRNTMNSKIPILALTADVTTVDLAKCKAVGMNDYIAKPVDERVLYNKIIGLVKKPSVIKPTGQEESGQNITKKTRCIDLNYLMHRTKNKPELMLEMISLYLAQTPPLVSAMKKSLHGQDWETLQAVVHKMIPSFSIVGISSDFEHIAKKIQEYANSQQEEHNMHSLVLQLENVCMQACGELEEEFNRIKSNI